MAASTRALSCTAADNVRRAEAANIQPRSGRVLVIAIGSSSTAGAFASSPLAAYPAQLQGILANRKDVALFEIINKGAGGSVIADIQVRLQRDVLSLNPQLVILQTGTNEPINAQNSAALDDFRSKLEEVILTLKASTTVLVMNGQAYPSQPSKYTSYQDSMEEVTAKLGVPIFDRYRLMRSWIDSGLYTYSQILASDNFHVNDFTYKCMAEVVADFAQKRTTQKAPPN